jgi:hypothetical protein
MEAVTTVNGQPKLSCVMAVMWCNAISLDELLFPRQRLGNTVSLLFVVNPTALVSCDVIHVCGKMQSSKENCDKSLKVGQILLGGRKCVIFHVKYK